MLIGFQWSFHCLWHFTYVVWGLKTLIGFLISVESRWPVLSKCNIMLLNLVTCLRSPFDFSNLAQVSSTFYFYFFYSVICFGGYLLHGFTLLCILYLCVFYSYSCGCWIFFSFGFLLFRLPCILSKLISSLSIIVLILIIPMIKKLICESGSVV